MRKILWGLLLTFLIAMPVYGYTVVKGDTPYELWGANWKTELAKYGISDPRKLPVGLEVELNEGMLGATPTPTSSANRKYVESPDFYLYSPAVAADTTITLNTLKDIYGNILTMDDIGTLGYGRIDPDSASISESITFSGITANSDGTYTLTGVKSALAKYPYTQTSGLKRSHSINAIFRLTNTAAFYDGFANKDNNEIVDGWWTFTSPTTSIFYAFPTVSSSAYTGLPTQDGQLVTKYYVDTVGAGGFTSANVSTTRGLSVDGSSPEKVGINASSTTGMIFDGNGALYQAIGNALEYTGNAIAVSTSTIVSQIATSTPTANMIPIANADSDLLEWVGIKDYFGNGADGDVVLSVSTTLTDDMYYNNLIIENGVVLNTGGHRIYVRGTLSNYGSIQNVGSNGTSAVGMSAGVGGDGASSGSLKGGSKGGNGAGGIYFSSAGGGGGAAISSIYILGRNGNAGGAGGIGGGYAAGAGGGVSSGVLETVKVVNFGTLTESSNLSSSTASTFNLYEILIASSSNNGDDLSSSGSGAGGGGGGRADGESGGGGGGGGSGGVVLIIAYNFNNQGSISVIGGNGGNGANGTIRSGGGGGGSGGSGGVVVLIYRYLLNEGTLDVAGGSGGAKGLGVGENSTNGADGSSGNNGSVYKLKVF